MSKLPTPPPPASPGIAAGSAAQVGRGIALAALLIAAGNIASRLLGQVRESVIAAQFGLSVASGAFAIASRVPTTLYDLLVGGLVSAALVPIFSELAERDERDLGRVASTVFTVALLLMAGLAALAWLLAPALGSVIDGPIQQPTIELIRWMLPATIFMGFAGLLTGLLQSRRRFLLPAFSTATFNLGIIAAAMLWAGWGIRSLALGMIVGAAGQVLLQLPGTRGVALRPRLELSNPDVRRIGLLYLPVLLGLGFSIVGTFVDSVLAAPLDGGTAAAQMRYATTLVQLALGIVATAISIAALPTLSRQGMGSDLAQFRSTLALSIKGLLYLLIPATALLAALAFPVVSFLFQWNRTDAAAARLIALALLLYLPMLIAAGVDQPLIMAFYARRNTLLPNLVNGGAIAAYLLVALVLVRPLGVYGLILGNVAQWWTHAVLMLWFAHTRLDALRGQRLAEAAGKGLLAAAAAGAATYGLYSLFGAPESKWTTFALIVALGAFGLAVYMLVARLVRLEAQAVIGGALLGRVRRRRR